MVLSSYIKYLTKSYRITFLVILNLDSIQCQSGELNVIPKLLSIKFSNVE